MHTQYCQLLGVMLLGVAGCSGNNYPTVPVGGTVTFDGGPCPGPGVVIFQPVGESDSGQRPGRGKFKEDGSFLASTYAPGDGLLPGSYLMQVQCDKGQPNPASPDPFGEITWVDPKYKPQEIQVQKGAKLLDIKIDVPLRE
ncbi:hypothetical protein Pan181_28790 [Aeoliella mucimassa]|uniref:Carboxypeptidase regulatory-like domain-containing protein n=1 Tax=Aeoliella mucimassa TaxID=2527972 RepID=A0A518APL9_9BACT|nr:hypothetical protein Pan181_28790 [Aeoliella mucimassa]